MARKDERERRDIDKVEGMSQGMQNRGVKSWCRGREEKRKAHRQDGSVVAVKYVRKRQMFIQ